MPAANVISEAAPLPRREHEFTGLDVLAKTVFGGDLSCKVAMKATKPRPMLPWRLGFHRRCHHLREDELSFVKGLRVGIPYKLSCCISVTRAAPSTTLNPSAAASFAAPRVNVLVVRIIPRLLVFPPRSTRSMVPTSSRTTSGPTGR